MGWLRWKLHKRLTGHHCFQWDADHLWGYTFRRCTVCGDRF